MQLETWSEGPVLVVKLLGRALDAYAAGGFRERMVALIQAGHDCVVLDLEAVEFLDSAGVGALVSCKKQLGDSGSIALCSVNPRVQEIFRLTRMDRVFRIASDAKEAVAGLAVDNT